MAEVALSADIRRTLGSPASRRLRAAGKIPAVLYGHGVDPTALAVEGRSLRQALNTGSGLNVLLQLDVEGTRHLALAREIQRHPVRNTVAHVDFQIVGRNEAVLADVPLNFVGEADAVTKNGGIVEHVLTSLSVSATPSTIPSHVDVDISNLQLDESIRVKDLPLPIGVLAATDGEEVVVVGSAGRLSTAGAEAESADTSPSAV